MRRFLRGDRNGAFGFLREVFRGTKKSGPLVYQTNLLEIAVHLRRRSRSGRLAEGEAAIPFYVKSGQVISARGCVKNRDFAKDRRKTLSAD